VVPGLPSRHPIGELLPLLYADDDLAQRFTAGLDTVLAPVFATLDNLPAYFEPRLAPMDFVAWLAAWVGADDAPGGADGPRREAVRRAVELHRLRGTRRGLRERLRLLLGVEAEIVDGGGAAWSTAPDVPLPPPPTGELLVRVRPVRGAQVDRAQVVDIVRESCPVHLTYRVEILAEPSAGEES
jgi:phage tail-like protein